MPRTAIISDIHANLDALRAVMKDYQEQQCTEVVCLGDVVGYNAYPSECLDLIRSLNGHVIKGNHDEEVVSCNKTMMNPMARLAMDWTRSQLRKDQLSWLSSLPYMRIIRHSRACTYGIVHSSMEKPQAWHYIINASDAAANFAKQFPAIAFHGHTHIPKVFIWDGRHAVEDSDAMGPLYEHGSMQYTMQAGLKYFINVGSVGQPRDHDPRACYTIFDTDTHTITMRRVAYDIAAAQQAILDRNISEAEFLAERLATGC
ncbi:MAG: metallophosphoesterase family protein [Akkermansia sp.]|nr:metallophosphoesterase family protein [Akkermansia sp.]